MKNKITFSNYRLISVFAALLFSVSLSILAYILYFQSYSLSLKRGLLAGFLIIILSINFYLILRVLIEKSFPNDYSQSLRSLGFWLFIAFLLSPCFLPIPHYPVSALFQHAGDMTLTIQTGKTGGQLNGVRLRFDDEVYSCKDFRFSNEWNKESDCYSLGPNMQGKLFWEGKLGRVATLTILPLDTETKVVVVWDGEETTSILGDKPLVVKKKSEAPVWYYILITTVWIIFLGFIFFIFFNLYRLIDKSNKKWLVVFFILLVLCVYTVYAQFENPEIKGRLDRQIERHQAVLTGGALNPWQYRVLSEWLIDGLISVAEALGFGENYFGVFVLFRIVENAAIFFLGYLYFRKLGFSDQVSLVGIIFVTGSMLNSFHQSDLSFNTYLDVIFYLAAALLILEYSFAWIPILMFAASLNRETSGLIPFLALATLPGLKNHALNFFYIILSLGVWGAVFFSLRLIYPQNDLFIPYGYNPGLPLLGYNLSLFSLVLMLRFFSFAPFVGLFFYRDWNFILKRFFVALIPVWFVVHFFGSVVSEARLFLVPQFIVFIPAFLMFVQNSYGNKSVDQIRLEPV